MKMSPILMKYLHVQEGLEAADVVIHQGEILILDCRRYLETFSKVVNLKANVYNKCTIVL